MIISHFVAIGENAEIGKGNKMLWHIPEDFKNFKKITSGHHLLMGRKTYESIGRLLPNRISLIVSRNKKLKVKGAFVFDSIEKAVTYAKKNNEDELFIIGGAEIYKQSLKITQKIYLSVVKQSYQADTFYPKSIFNDDIWETCSNKIHPKENLIPLWEFKILKRR